MNRSLDPMWMKAFIRVSAVIGLILLAFPVQAQEPPQPDTAQTAPADETQANPDKPQPKIPAVEELTPGSKVADLPGLKPLSAKYGLWVDPKRKWVVMDAKVCLTQGVLEMFACPRSTKEHESVISVDCPARYVHAALLAIGAKAGRPVQFDPQYLPAHGQIIDVHILWVDKNGKKKSARAQEWIRNTKTKEEMKHPFVFAGSDFWSEEIDGKRHEHYMADAGDLICVSNFPSATLDIPVKSSKENSQLLFEVFSERLPARGTKLRLVLIPRPDPLVSDPPAAGKEPEPNPENPPATGVDGEETKGKQEPDKPASKGSPDETPQSDSEAPSKPKETEPRKADSQ